MKTLLRTALPTLAALLLSAHAAADPPPPQAQLKKLLKTEPVDLPNWPKWSPKLREWSGADFTKGAWPASVEGMEFVKRQQKKFSKGNNLSMGQPLDKDAVAWMLLAGAYQHDTKPVLRPGDQARLIAEAARRAIQLDDKFARAHYYRARGLEREQQLPQADGGPAQPDRGRLEEALRELLRARELDPATQYSPPANVGALAIRLEKWDIAETYYREALAQKPDDVKLARTVARVINEFKSRPETFAAAVKPLVDRFPTDGGLAAHHALALSHDKKVAEAKSELQRARSLDPNAVNFIGPGNARAIDEGTAANAPPPRPDDPFDRLVAAPISVARTFLYWLLVFAIVYGTIMVLMCLGGLVLARYTRGPKAADLLGKPPEQLAAAGQVARTKHESWLTRFYAFALLLALVLFYVSLPFVFLGMLIILLFSVLLALLLHDKRGNSADVQGALLRAGGGGVGAVFKAMFARVGTGSDGVRKGRDDCPKLYAALEEVARRVDTDPVDEVWIAPGAAFGVHQEGRGPFGVFGGRKRVLTLGLCVMHYLSVSELKAILAHEYAHFSHADTFWNRFLFQVTLSLRTAMREMARTGGWIAYVNPFYWFFWSYSKSYSLLSGGFSRSREFLADRMACSLYGADVFARALRKVCTDGTHFECTVYENIVRLLKAKKAYVNMYLAFRKHRDENLTEEARRKLHRALLDDKPSVFASHPTFQERVQAATQLPRAQKTEDASSLELFDSAEAIEREMTDFLTELVAHYMRV